MMPHAMTSLEQADQAIRKLKLQVTRHQRRHEHMARHLAEVVCKSEARQVVINRLDSRLLGIYRFVAVDEREPEERLRIIGKIVEETIPRKVERWLSRRQEADKLPDPRDRLRGLAGDEYRDKVDAYQEIVRRATGSHGHAIRCGWVLLEPAGLGARWDAAAAREYVGWGFRWFPWGTDGAIVEAEPFGDGSRLMVEVWAVPNTSGR